MARRPPLRELENRTARLKLPIKRKPQAWTAIAPGIRLGYPPLQRAEPLGDRSRRWQRRPLAEGDRARR